MMPWLYPESGMGKMDEMVPEGFRHYAKIEGLDPSSYFARIEEKPVRSNNPAFQSVAGGNGLSWRALSRLVGILLR
jgi:hypothetical protein